MSAQANRPANQRLHGYLVTPTSPEVWAALRTQHGPQLSVFSSFSDPDGTFHGGWSGEGCMETVYGFKSADYPLMAARSTWTTERTDDGAGYRRSDERHEYFLVLPEKERDE